MRYETVEKGGESFVMLPIKEFNKLRDDKEMLSDIKAYDDAKAEGGEYFPSEVVYALINGKNPIKVFREYRKMTQEDLSKKTGLARAYIAQLETGKKKGSVAGLKGIANALEVDLEDIV